MRQRPVTAGEAAVDRAGGFGRSGKGDARDARIAGQRRANRAVAGDELHRAVRHPGGVEQPHGEVRDQRGLLGGFGQHGVAGRQRPGDQPGENRQREVPRRNRHERPAPVQGQAVALARRAGQRLAFRREQAARLGGVIAQEIDRLAQFQHGIGQGLAGLALAEREERVAVRLVLVGHGFEQRGPFRSAARIPLRLGGERTLDHGGNFVWPGIAAMAHHHGAVMRAADRARGGSRCGLCRWRGGPPGKAAQLGQRCRQGFAHQRIGQIDPRAVGARGEQRRGQRDRRIAARGQRGEFRHRIAGQVRHRHFGIGHAVDEG